MSTEMQEIRAALAAIRAKIDKPAKRKDRRAILQCRMNADEMILLDAACAARGLCRADMVRLGLNAVIGADLRINRDIPPELRRFTVRHKPDHFADQKTSVVERNQASARENAARQAVRLGLEAKRLMIDADAASHAHIPVEQGMIGDSRSAPLSGKLSR